MKAAPKEVSAAVSYPRLESFIDFVLRRRWLVIALSASVMLLMTAGLPRISITSDYRVMFGKGQP